MRTEPVFGIGPGGFDLEAGAQKEITNAGDGVLVTVLGVDALALLERNLQTYQLHFDRLVEHAFKMHLDAGTIRIPQGYVAEEVEIEIAAEFTVDARQDVLIEAAGDALRVVIGG